MIVSGLAKPIEEQWRSYERAEKSVQLQPMNTLNHTGAKRTLSRTCITPISANPTMADGDEFFDCFSSFSNFLYSETPDTETTEEWEYILTSQMSWDNNDLLKELSDIPLADIPSPLFDHEALPPLSLELQTDTHGSATDDTCSACMPSVAHDHTYVQKPPVLSKVLVVKDGKSSVKETSCVRTRDCSPRLSSEGLHTQLTKVNQGELPLVLAHDDVGELRPCGYTA